MFADISLCMTGLENRFYMEWLQLRLQEMQFLSRNDINRPDCKWLGLHVNYF